jgi:hypothetical protein
MNCRIPYRAFYVNLLRGLLSLSATLVFLAQGATAQTSTAGKTPLGLAPGAPEGSYSLSGFDQINFYNGSLNFALPLMHIGGRGAAGYTMMFRPSQPKWQVQHVITQQCNQEGCWVTGEHYYPTTNWWVIEPGYSPGVLVGRKAGEGQAHPSGCPIGTDFWGSALTRISFTAADGTEYELRDQRLGGQPQIWEGTSCNSQGALRGRVFVSGDGTSMTFISDADIYDSWFRNPQTFYPSGYLLFSDGTRYRIDEGKVSWIRDTNGNKVTFTYNETWGVTSIVDSINRRVDISYNPVTITYKGFAGGPRTIQIATASTTDILRPCRSDPGYQCYSPQTYNQLFPSLDGSSSTTFSTTEASTLTLPNNRQYKFYYSSYGELARVDLPTGGVIEYDYASGSALDSTGVIIGQIQGQSEKAIYRRVIERRVYPDGITLEGKTTYSAR